MDDWVKNDLRFYRTLIGRILWYFIKPYAEELACDYTYGLVDQRDFDSTVGDLRHDINMVTDDIARVADQ